MPKDNVLYNRLGISPNSTDSEIKKAYNLLSKQYHPDKNPDEKKEESSVKFKEITDAKDILMDENKRREYDQIGMDIFKQKSNLPPGGFPGGFPGFPAGFPGFPGFPGANFNFGGMNINPTQNGKILQPIIYNMTVSLEQIYKKEKVFIGYNIQCDCKLCEGEGGKNTICGSCNGSGKSVKIIHMGNMIQQMISQCDSCNGKGKIVTNTCNLCKGSGNAERNETIDFYLNTSLSNGQQIKINAKGNESKNLRSELIINLTINEHPVYKKHDNHLYTKIELSLYEALFGYKKIIKLLNGEEHVIESNTKTISNTVLSIQLSYENILYILLSINIPDLENEWKDILQTINTAKKEDTDNKNILHTNYVTGPFNKNLFE
jgi:DnaJ-class molecular chaperone